MIALASIAAAIAAHRAAYDAFQVAPDGGPSLEAEDVYDEASMALVVTGCTDAAEARALHDHLGWWLKEEAEFADGHQPAYRIAQARYGDLAIVMAASDLGGAA